MHSRSASQISRREARRINFLARLSMSTFTCTHDALDDAMHVHIEVRGRRCMWVKNGGALGDWILLVLIGSQLVEGGEGSR